MWFWLRNQRNQQAKNSQGRRTRKQTAVPKVRLLLNSLEERITPTVVDLRTGVTFTNTNSTPGVPGDAIQKAIDFIDHSTPVNSTLPNDTLVVFGDETYLGF